jgi:hypothetical protein
MAKADLVQKALRMELGTQEELEAKTVAQLEELISANQDAGETPSASAASGKSNEDKGDDPRTGKMIEMQIEVDARPGGQSDVYGSVNGYTFLIKRGKPVKVDRWIYDHLTSLKDTNTESVSDDRGRPTGETQEVEMKRFNITRLD